jgi:hypothetical protein
MNEIEQSKDEIIAALIESNDILQTELTNVRRSHRTLRTVISALRRSVNDYKAAIISKKFTDEVFKEFCDGKFDVPVGVEETGGLPNSSTPVEPTVANVEEASIPNTHS